VLLEVREYGSDGNSPFRAFGRRPPMPVSAMRALPKGGIVALQPPLMRGILSTMGISEWPTSRDINRDVVC
jgi:hypothetical protein